MLTPELEKDFAWIDECLNRMQFRHAKKLDFDVDVGASKPQNWREVFDFDIWTMKQLLYQLKVKINGNP